MCDSHRPLNGADSEELPEHPTTEYIEWTKALREPLYQPVWPSRAVNGGWDAPHHTDTPDGSQAGTEPSTLRLVA